MTPEWVNETVRGFGRQMGLKSFTLNDRGVAGLLFENGVRIHLEHVDGALMMSAGIVTDDSAATMKRFLAGVHPSARTGVRMRAVRHAHAGESCYVARLADRELTTASLETAFRALWRAADYLKGALA